MAGYVCMQANRADLCLPGCSGPWPKRNCSGTRSTAPGVLPGSSSLESNCQPYAKADDRQRHAIPASRTVRVHTLPPMPSWTPLHALLGLTTASPLTY
jgi:hypothetical protein